jgi:hypothetical protein
MNQTPNCGEMSGHQKAMPRFLRVDEVADLLRCKKRTIYDMVERFLQRSKSASFSHDELLSPDVWMRIWN